MDLQTLHRGEYERRRQSSQGLLEGLRRIDDRVGTLGLWSALASALVGGAALLGLVRPLGLAIPVAFLLGLRLLHVRYRTRMDRHRAVVAHYDHGLARMADDWAGRGREGLEYEASAHPYSSDLDLFGRGSLFQLLCTAQTRAGEKSLSHWLLEPASGPEIRERQEAVTELRDRLDLREDLARQGDPAIAHVKPEELVAWGREAPRLGGFHRLAAWLLSAGSLVTLGLFVTATSPYPLAGQILAIIAFNWWTSARVNRTTHLAERAEREFDVLSRLFARLGRESFTGPKLRTLHESFLQASGEWDRLARWVQRLQSVRNELVGALAGLVLWRMHCALALERWRVRWGSYLDRWLWAIGEFEALNSFAAYAFENPGDPFPEILPSGAVFDGEGLGHPLLPHVTCVSNDVRLGPAPRVLVVSGSNMSGKSTLLRTVGVNAVLALAGAPVRARRLSISPLSVGATLRVQDSLQGGVSRFFVEISRIKQLLGISEGSRPLLFLLEELLAGTNSQDRRIGAEGLIREFLARGAIGLLTTHDLALAGVADALEPEAANVHFEDQLVDGKLSFDYRLRQGVVTKSNALELMRAVGLLSPGPALPSPEAPPAEIPQGGARKPPATSDRAERPG